MIFLFTNLSRFFFSFPFPAHLKFVNIHYAKSLNKAPMKHSVHLRKCGWLSLAMSVLSAPEKSLHVELLPFSSNLSSDLKSR